MHMISSMDKPEPLTAAQRKAAERQRQKEAGRVPVTVWVWPEFRADVRAHELRMQKRERRK